ncbi:paraquat-inducible protein A [Roseospirillum parvum]|uniref:Paraquat-inducible protein A n=1 Tax=Roseospirillum parvum TaxID=83401 RepID=A0A1G8F671_9PROT|nr:paraquat-inducible protein A [Roseospirillum parvum]SDH77626.1 paraquat-inducible protein A [Roseospirillum parvum]
MSSVDQAGLAACPECDELHVRRPLRRGERARCARCGTTLYRMQRRRPEQMLAIVTAALIAFVLANTFPILVLRSQGMINEATLLGSVATLWAEGQQVAAVMVFFTAWLFPLFDLLSMFLLLLAVETGWRPAFFAPLLRALQAMRPWGMIEVLMLGVVVSLIKLSNMADVVPGAALWAFMALTVLLAVILSYDLRALWRPGCRRAVAP